MNNVICPWDRLAPSHINFCEEKLCSWIVKPAETWSNVSFILTGILVIYLAKKENRRHLTPIGYIGIILGIFSAFFHASGTHLGSWLDISSMHLFTGIGIAYNLKRYKEHRVLPTFLLVVIPSCVLIYLWEVFGIVLFGLQFIAGFALEFLIYKKTKTRTDYVPLFTVIGTVGIAWTIWWLDITKVWCDPANHIYNGHAIWHLMVGTTFYFIYRFYSQFEFLRPPG